ncbi:MAG: energy-coupling factor transporter transmembrane protein EcfT [Clostridia bacterium]|nr:energy-coupling factor transporter transmembrane protein EcfT [Clostridia bacterium]
MLSEVTFGQYYPSKSFVHRLDPRVKILLLIAYIVMIFTAQNFLGLIASLLFLSLTIIFSGVPIGSVLKSIKAILFLVIFTAILNILFYSPKQGDTHLFWVVYVEGLISAGFLALRLISLVMGSSILTLTTTPVSLTDGIESLLSPLKLVKFPVHDLALIMSIALRSIPTLANETERIINAQKARGADFDSGNIIKKAKALVPVLIPLLISAFRRGDELGDAMDARCYSGSKVRTKYKKLTLSVRDLIAFLVTVVAFAGVILLNIYELNVLAYFAKIWG